MGFFLNKGEKNKCVTTTMRLAAIAANAEKPTDQKKNNSCGQQNTIPEVTCTVCLICSPSHSFLPQTQTPLSGTSEVSSPKPLLRARSPSTLGAQVPLQAILKASKDGHPVPNCPHGELSGFFFSSDPVGSSLFQLMTIQTPNGGSYKICMLTNSCHPLLISSIHYLR